MSFINYDFQGSGEQGSVVINYPDTSYIYIYTLW